MRRQAALGLKGERVSGRHLAKAEPDSDRRSCNRRAALDPNPRPLRRNPAATPIAAAAPKHRAQVQRSRDIEPIDTDDRDDDQSEMPFAIVVVSGCSFGGSGNRGTRRQRMLEQRAGMRSTSRPGRSLFRTLSVYAHLALQTNLKSGVRIVTDQRNPRLMACLFDFRRTKVGEERDGALFCVDAPKNDAANSRRAVEARGGALSRRDRLPNFGGRDSRLP